MWGRSIRGAVAAAGAAALLWPVVAWADKQIEAGPPSRFTTPEVTMDQGERLTFRNGDTISHDVQATQAGPDGKPLFATPIVGAGRSEFVEGSQFLTAGSYPFICSLHNGMRGTLQVTTAGTPQPRPGEEAQPEPRPVDRTRPDLAVELVSRTARTARVRGALVVRVELGETSDLRLEAVARPRAGGPLVTIARRSLRDAATGVRRVRLTLTAAGRRSLRRDRPLAVVVDGVATDAAGNRARARHGRTLAP